MMAKIFYVEKKFRSSTLAIIEKANSIIEEYAVSGYDLTLRQLFYQFVSRDLLPNTTKSYNQLGSILNDARLAGLVDWDSITDRTRAVEKIHTWDNPTEIIDSCAYSFKTDLWKDQKYRVEVWIEKEALAGVFERICKELRIPYLSCRGYTSQSEMWRAGQRMTQYLNQDQTPVVLHFGDHDPSGMDMSNDIVNRLNIFMGGVAFERLALNMKQIEEFRPPPNPAKMTDSRAVRYVSDYGSESWELDALDPDVLSGLVRTAVGKLRDEKKWKESLDEENRYKNLLKRVSENWEEVTKQWDQ
jgi:hypothetical protein